MAYSIQVELEEKGPVLRKISVVVPAGEVEKERDKIYKRWGQRAKIKGFRPGKAPRSILKLYYGKEIEAEVAQEVFRQTLSEALEEARVRPLAVRAPERLIPPSPGDDLYYSVEVEVAPDFTPQNYLQLQLSDPGVEVTDAMVEERLEQIRQAHATLVELAEPRAVGPGDVVIFSYKAFEGEQEIPGGGSDNTYLELGSGKFPPEFETQLLGRQLGEEFRFPMTVPETFFNPLLRGRTVEFAVTIREIKELQVPELTDEFVQKLSDKFQTVADLRQAVRRDLELQGERERHEKLRQQVIDQLVEHNPIALPPVLVEQELDDLVRQQMRYLSRRGLDLNIMDPGKLREYLRPTAEKQVRTSLILGKIAELEGITVSPEDVEAAYRRIAAQVDDNPETVRRVYEERQMVDSLKSSILAEKTLEFLIDRNLEAQAGSSKDDSQTEES